MGYQFGDITKGIFNGVSNFFNGAKNNVKTANTAKNQYFDKAQSNLGNAIDQYTGNTGATNALNNGLAAGSQLTQLQSNGAAAQALGNQVSAGMTRGRAADAAGQAAANNFSNNFAQNAQNQQNQYMQSGLNNVNATAQYGKTAIDEGNNQYTKANDIVKKNTGLLGGAINFVKNTLFSDEELKDKTKVGLRDSDDPRMTHYKSCGDKLKQMNPNKWAELHWEAK